MNIFIGFLSSLFILFLFFLFNRKKRSQFSITDGTFMVLIVFLSYFYNPLNHLLLWFGWFPVFYATLDDMTTKTFRIDLPLYAVAYFCVMTFHPSQLILCSVSFCFLFLLYKLSEGGIQEGDAYFAIPLVYFLSGAEALQAFYISLVLGVIVFMIIQLFSKEQEHPFLPIMLLSSFIVMSDWHVTWFIFLGTISSFICSIIFIFRKKSI